MIPFCIAQRKALTRLASLATLSRGELLRRSVVLAGHRTSISIERAFWDALKEIAAAEGVSLNRLVTEIDRARPGNLSSAVRLFVLRRARAGAPIACAAAPPKRP